MVHHCRECGKELAYVPFYGPEYGHMMPHDLPAEFVHADGPQGHPAEPRAYCRECQIEGVGACQHWGAGPWH
jgi:hypothetical protein